jgi:hypothetical protein
MTRLRRISALLLAVTLALTLGMIPATTPLLAASVAQADDPAILGYYESDLIPGEGDTPDLVVGLILYEDGTAEVISDYQNDEDVITEVGTWVDNGDGTVTLTVTGTTKEDYAAPIDLDFQVADDGSLVVPGAANGAFGEAGLTLAPTPLGNSDAILANIPADAVVYQSDVMPSTSGPGLQLTLALFDDNSLTLVSDYMDPGNIVVEIGTWSEGDDGSLAVTLTGQVEDGEGTVTEYEEPLDFVFTTNDDGSLALVDEGGALFGDAGLTLMPAEATGEVSSNESAESVAEEAASAETTPEATEEATSEETPAATEEAPVLEATPEATEEATPEATEEVTATATAEVTSTATVTEEGTISETTVVTPSGAYVSGLLPSDEDNGTFLVTIFYDDGTLLFSTYSLNGDLPILEVGTWAADVDGSYTITATGTTEEDYDEPVAVPFTVSDNGTITISGVDLYPVANLNLANAPTLVAEFQSDAITDTTGVTQTVTLALYDDLSAEMTSDYLDGSDPTTEYGEWSLSDASDVLTVTLTSNVDGEYDTPVEWLFDVAADDTLILSNDDEGIYGEDGLTLSAVEVDGTELMEGDTTSSDTSGDTTSDDVAADSETAAGTQLFQSDVLPAASSPGLQLTLGLLDDGSAAIDYDYLNGEDAITNTGEWVDNGDDTLTVTFTEGPNGTLDLPVELTLQLDDAGNLVITDASDESAGLIDVVLAPVPLE